MLNLAVQYIDKSHKHFLPKTFISFCLKKTQDYLHNHQQNILCDKKNINKNTPADADIALTVRFIDMQEAQALNLNYRNKDYATNVLTFVYPNYTFNKVHSNGQIQQQNICADIVLCCPIVEQEAITDGKSLLAHYVHLLIHGMLHAYGYDHETPEENTIMQAIEVAIMHKLGFLNPY